MNKTQLSSLVGGINEKAEGLDEVSLLFRVEGDEAEATGLFVGFVIAVRRFADLRIAQCPKYLGLFRASNVLCFAFP